MPRTQRKDIVYTGKALKLYKKVQKIEADLKETKEELKAAYKAQLKAEKVALAKKRNICNS